MTLPGDAPDLQLGDSGEWVAELERLLHVLAHLDRTPDRTFDDATRRAVEQFQTNTGLSPSGSVDKETWAALVAAAPAETGAVEPSFEYQPSTGQPSEDGEWIWDGERWVGAGDGRPEPEAADPAAGGIGQLSADQQWRWDGVAWQPAGQEA